MQHDWKDTLCGVHVHVSPGSAETSVRRGGITHHRLVAYSLSNISAKNYQNRLMCVEVICAKSVSLFLRHSVLGVDGSSVARCTTDDISVWRSHSKRNERYERLTAIDWRRPDKNRLTLSVPHFSDCSKMSLPNRSGPYSSNPPFFNFWHSGSLALSPERQRARMSKIKNGGLDQYGPGRSEV